ncbi:MAG TPA: hypothetical protein VJT67_11380, partial [Longimicrobiaceae bacterium]|nr:hypothetical protein [Longimicrobiaceae bacterium]
EQAYGRAHLRLLTVPAAGSLQVRETGTAAYSLVAGRDYSVIAVCDEGCDHPTLDFPAPAGAVLNETSSQERVATVKIRPRRAGEYAVRIRMGGCRSERCAYAIGLLGP